MAGVEVVPRNIDTSHRIGAPKPGKARAIIVRFTHFTARQAVYNARRALRKPLSFNGSVVTGETARSVFISDSLTRDNQQILYEARQLKRQERISAAWSDVGKLKVRVRQGGPTHIIRSVHDLKKLVGPEQPAATPAAATSAATTSAATFEAPVSRRQKRNVGKKNVQGS